MNIENNTYEITITFSSRGDGSSGPMPNPLCSNLFIETKHDHPTVNGTENGMTKYFPSARRSKMEYQLFYQIIGTLTFNIGKIEDFEQLKKSSIFMFQYNCKAFDDVDYLEYSKVSIQLDSDRVCRDCHSILKTHDFVDYYSCNICTNVKQGKHWRCSNSDCKNDGKGDLKENSTEESDDDSDEEINDDSQENSIVDFEEAIQEYLIVDNNKCFCYECVSANCTRNDYLCNNQHETEVFKVIDAEKYRDLMCDNCNGLIVENSIERCTYRRRCRKADCVYDLCRSCSFAPTNEWRVGDIVKINCKKCT